MSDLDAAIRAKLDGYVNEGCGYSGHDCQVTGHEEMKAALLGALDQHSLAEFYGAAVADPSTWICQRCHEADPCPTRWAIATALGIEVGGG